MCKRGKNKVGQKWLTMHKIKQQRQHFFLSEPDKTYHITERREEGVGGVPIVLP